MNSDEAAETFYCFACRCEHRGTTFRDHAGLFARVSCPTLGDRIFPLSSDAELFAAFRKGEISGSVHRRHQFALLHITDQCSLRCPICYAESGEGNPVPYEDVLRLARRTVAAGVRKLTLTGGEPAEHPDILRIVSALAHDMKASVSLLTNGMRLASEESFARNLKTAGLRKVHISFDTLSGETSLRMRGTDCVEQRKTAFARAAEAGLALAANVTVCDLNLDEVGEVFRYLASNVPGLSHVLFQPQCGLGRGVVRTRIDREDVVKALARSPLFPVDDAYDFIPMPQVPAWGVGVHPDCGTLTSVVVDGCGGNATLRSLDAGRRGWTLLRRLAMIDGRPGLSATIRTLAAWMRHAGLSGLPLLGRWWRGGCGRHVVLAVVDNLPDADFMLVDRIRRCCSGVACENGELAPVCAGYRIGRKEAP